MKRLTVAISGASGVIYAIHLLKALENKAFVHIVISDVAKSILKQEVGWDVKDQSISEFIKDRFKLKSFSLDSEVLNNKNLYAAIASGSYKTDGMVICPCSMKTLSGVAQGRSENLIERAADVTLKERRKLILVTRETPLSRIHIKNMLDATDAGAIIVPATPGFYHGENEMDQMIDFVAARALNLMDIDQDLLKEWNSPHE